MLCKKNKNNENLGNFLDKEVENLGDHGCPKVQDFVNE